MTKEVLDRGAMERARRSVGPAELDDRIVMRPPCRWDATLSGSGGAAAEQPSVVIMTHGSFMASPAFASPSAPGVRPRAPSQWADSVARLVGLKSIATVVIDECSQLWEGHSISLMGRFPASSRLVLVGDDHQLPPYGSEAASKALPAGEASKSLFDAARECAPAVPITQLDVSYRLGSPVAEVLADAFYGGSLSVSRNAARDAIVHRRLSAGLNALRGASPLARSAMRVSLLRGTDAAGAALPSRRLLWLHVPGRHENALGGASKKNDLQARAIQLLAPDLLAALREGERLDGLADSGYAVDDAHELAADEPEEAVVGGVGALADGSDGCDADGDSDGDGDRDSDVSTGSNGRDAACARSEAVYVAGGGDDEGGTLPAAGRSNAAAAVPTTDVDASCDGGSYAACDGARGGDEKPAEATVPIELAEAAAAASEAALNQAMDVAQERARARLADEQTGRQRSRLNVISPYEAQRAQIESTVAERLKLLTRDADAPAFVRSSRIVGNVDALQGQEADICIVSTERAPALRPQVGAGAGQGSGLGFLADNRRVNVMLSRAQQVLIIVGDFERWLHGGPRGSLIHAFAAKALAEDAVFGLGTAADAQAAGEGAECAELERAECAEAPGGELHCVRAAPALRARLRAAWAAPLPPQVPAGALPGIGLAPASPRRSAPDVNARRGPEAALAEQLRLLSLSERVPESSTAATPASAAAARPAHAPSSMPSASAARAAASAAERPHNWRTVACMHFARGACAYGDSCNFRHDKPRGSVGRRGLDSPVDFEDAFESAVLNALAHAPGCEMRLSALGAVPEVRALTRSFLSSKSGAFRAAVARIDFAMVTEGMYAGEIFVEGGYGFSNAQRARLHAALRASVTDIGAWVQGASLGKRFPRSYWGRYPSLLLECERAGLECSETAPNWWARRRS